MKPGLRTPRLVALFGAGWALLNFPLLTLWDRGAMVAGVPLLPAAVFGGWAVLIAVAAWVAERGEDDDGDDGGGNTAGASTPDGG